MNKHGRDDAYLKVGLELFSGLHLPPLVSNVSAQRAMSSVTVRARWRQARLWPSRSLPSRREEAYVVATLEVEAVI